MNKMTRSEAMAAIQADPNVKVTHDYFSPEEYLYMKDGKIYTEEGYLFEDFDPLSANNGMRLRDGENWATGWSIWKEPEDKQNAGNS